MYPPKSKPHSLNMSSIINYENFIPNMQLLFYFRYAVPSEIIKTYCGKHIQ